MTSERERLERRIIVDNAECHVQRCPTPASDDQRCVHRRSIDDALDRLTLIELTEPKASTG